MRLYSTRRFRRDASRHISPSWWLASIFLRQGIRQLRPILALFLCIGVSSTTVACSTIEESPLDSGVTAPDGETPLTPAAVSYDDDAVRERLEQSVVAYTAATAAMISPQYERDPILHEILIERIYLDQLEWSQNYVDAGFYQLGSPTVSHFELLENNLPGGEARILFCSDISGTVLIDERGHDVSGMRGKPILPYVMTFSTVNGGERITEIRKWERDRC